MKKTGAILTVAGLVLIIVGLALVGSVVYGEVKSLNFYGANPLERALMVVLGLLLIADGSAIIWLPKLVMEEQKTPAA